MEIAQGAHRFVMAFPSLGIAIKVAKIHPWLALKSFLSIFKRYKKYAKPRLVKVFLILYYEVFKYSPYHLTTIKHHLFVGIYDNWREFMFYQRTKNPFLQPTWFSFFGLFNLQRYGRPGDKSLGNVYLGLYYLTERQISNDAHYFDEPANFTVENNRLKILDYGYPYTKPIIEKYGRRIWEEFDPSQNAKQEADK